jgi:hypothetical protein
MNLQITNAIAGATNAVVTYDTDDRHTTTYHLSKPVGGKQVTVDVPVSAETHASTSAFTLAEHVTKRAAVLFAEIRKLSEKKPETPAA